MPAPRAIVATSNMDALQDALKVTGACSTIVYFGLPGPDDLLKVPVLEAIQSERTLKFARLAPLVWDNVFPGRWIFPPSLPTASLLKTRKKALCS